jgi:hypothetical protein
MGIQNGANTLGGLLQSLQVAISPSQLLALPNQPILLLGSPPPGYANLIRSIVASLRFGTTPFTANPGSRAQVLYGGPSRLGVDAQLLSIPPGPFPFISFAGTAVANASGGNTTYSANLAAVATNALAGYPCVTSGYSHAANNAPLTVVSNTQSAIVLNNPSGVAEASPPAAANIQIYSSLALAGFGGGVDLTTLLTSAQGNAVQVFELGNVDFPTVEIAAAPIYLGTAASAWGLPQNFSAGDSSLLLTILYLQIQL